MQKTVERYAIMESSFFTGLESQNKHEGQKKLAVTVHSGTDKPLSFHSYDDIGISVKTHKKESLLKRNV